MDSGVATDDGGEVFALPTGLAKAVVRRYEAHSFSGPPTGVHRGLPSHPLTFRFSLGEPTEIISMPDPRQAPGNFWSARFCVVNDVLGRILSSQENVQLPAEIVEAWRCIVASRGQTSVEELAAHVGWSRRHLASRFKTEVGLTPKALGRIVRFEHACELLLHARRSSLADVAAVAGYYDQSHLTRRVVRTRRLHADSMAGGGVPRPAPARRGVPIRPRRPTARRMRMRP